MGSHFHDYSDYNWVAFSIGLLEWGRKLSDFWGKQRLKMGRFSVKKKIRKLLFIKFNNRLTLTALNSAAWNHIDKVARCINRK